MFCMECGNQLSNDSRFCPKCGIPQDINPESLDTSNNSQVNIKEGGLGFENLAIKTFIGIGLVAALLPLLWNLNILSGVLHLHIGENKLEKLTNIGNANSEEFEHFKDEGGLENESNWHGFRAQSLSIGFDSNRLVKGYEIFLHKDWPTYSNATINSLKQSAPAICGNDWSRDDNSRFTTLASKNEKCLIQSESGSGYIRLQVGELI